MAFLLLHNYTDFINFFHDFPPFLRNLRFIDDFKRMRMLLYTLNIYHSLKK